jgi:hypothetical protein
VKTTYKRKWLRSAIDVLGKDFQQENAECGVRLTCRSDSDIEIMTTNANGPVPSLIVDKLADLPVLSQTTGVCDSNDYILTNFFEKYTDDCVENRIASFFLDRKRLTEDTKVAVSRFLSAPDDCDRTAACRKITI